MEVSLCTAEKKLKRKSSWSRRGRISAWIGNKSWIGENKRSRFDIKRSTQRECNLRVPNITSKILVINWNNIMYQISTSYSLSKISSYFPSSITFDFSFSFNDRSVLLTTPILMSIVFMSFFTYVIAFLMFCNGVLSLNCLPVSSIFRLAASNLLLSSVSSFSSSSTLLLTVLNASVFSLI